MATSGKQFTLSVMNEKSVLYYGDCEILFVPSKKGETAITAHHTPMIMQLTPGPVVMHLRGIKQTIATATTGVLYVAENKVSILVDL